VVTKGNFKIDSALQIEAKPSMMTPEGGGGSGGHQHGGPQKPATGAGPKAMIQIPAPSREQLRAVLSTAEKVNQAFERKDLGQIRTAFAGLEKSVKAVDMTALEGHPHMLWMEMSMRLGNDAVEGHNAKTLAEARRVFESLKTNASSLRAKFGLDHGGHEHE
jgi:Cu(I)/Ag(I) efflux system membrane fusion protein